MVRSDTPEPAGDGQSLGDLVALAAKDVSQLVRYEIDLAKTELMADVRRVGLAGALRGARPAVHRTGVRPGRARHLDVGGLPHRVRRLRAVRGPHTRDRLPEAAAAVRTEEDARDRIRGSRGTRP